MGLANNTKIQSYINEVCAQIKFRAIHQDIKIELKTHLEELIKDYTKEGFSENEGITKAIIQMGNANEVGQQLNIVHKSKPDWSLLALSFLLINVGLAAIYFIEKHSLSGPFPIFSKSLFFAIISGLLIGGIYFFDYRKLEKHSLKIYGGTLLAVAGTLLLGGRVNGQSYLIIGPISFNLLSISPIFFSLSLAGIFKSYDWNQPKKILQGLILAIIPLLFLVNGSLVPAIIYAGTAITLMIASGARPKYFLLFTGLVSTIMAGLVITAPYRLERLMAFLNPGQDPLGSGWLQNQLNNLISSSGFFGLGLTAAPRLPYVHTDFIFSYITFTFGWVAGGCLGALIILFILRITRIASLVKDNYARMLVIGFTAIFTIQFAWNILMNLGLVPISGVGLPLISFGGSQLIFNGVALGVISSIYRRRNIYLSSFSLGK